MTSKKPHQRMYDRARSPTDKDIIDFIADAEAVAAWKQVQEYLKTRYSMKKEILYYGDKYGWLVRYRKSGRTIVSLFPEKHGFSFLIVYGKEEITKFSTQESEFTPDIVDVFHSTKKLHDGKWLWIRVTDSTFFGDLTKLLDIKRKPMNID